MRQTLVYPLPMRDFMAQLVLPRNLTKEEADRICAVIQSLAEPTIANLKEQHEDHH